MRILSIGLLASALLVSCAPLAARTGSESPAVSSVRPDAKRPNVLVILLDDLGYSDLGTYGSEIRTPNIDRLATEGVAFTQFYVYPRCSPTRAALLTGAYPHESGLAFLTTPEGADVAEGPYQGYLDPSVKTLAGTFSDLGYRTYMSGKWHLGEASAHWPRKYGFSRYFGLISGASSYYELLDQGERTRRMAIDDAPYTPPAEGFYMTDAITSHAMAYLSEHTAATPEQPFFLYLAYTAPHWPLHAPEAEIDAYDGTYDAGWDVISRARQSRQEQLGLGNLPAAEDTMQREAGDWASYEDKQGWARRMQVHAAMVTIADRGIGDVVEELRRTGQLDSTIILVMSDNGASAEDVEGRGLNDPGVPVGLRGSYVSFGPKGAALANTPLRDFKGSAFEGGVRSPLIMHWPNGISQTGQVDQTSILNILDIAPSLLALTGSKPAESGMHLEGQVVAQTLTGQKSMDSGPFYWEHLGWRGVRDGKWKAVSEPASDVWQLFDLETDATEASDVSSQFPAVTQKLQSDWTDWADKIGVAPLPMDELMRLFAPPHAKSSSPETSTPKP